MHLPLRPVCSLGLLLVFVAQVNGTASAVGPRVVIADQQQHRILLIDRTTTALLKQNARLTRADCVARGPANRLLACDGTTIAVLDSDLNVLSRIKTAAQRVSAVAVAGPNSLFVSDTILKTFHEVDLMGNPSAWALDVHWPQDIVRLPSGNTVVADGTSMLKEFTPARAVARSIQLTAWGASLSITPRGEILVGESGAYELFAASGKRLWSREWPNKRITCIEALAAGEIMLCDPDARRVVIVDKRGDEVWRSGEVGAPWKAAYLR